MRRRSTTWSAKCEEAKNGSDMENGSSLAFNTARKGFIHRGSGICILLSRHWPGHHLCNPTATGKRVTSTMSSQLDANLASAVESLISSMGEALSSIQDRVWSSVMSLVFCAPLHSSLLCFAIWVLLLTFLLCILPLQNWVVYLLFASSADEYDLSLEIFIREGLVKEKL